MDIELIRTADRLEAIAPDWKSLWSGCPSATPFQSPAWLLPWWHHYGNDQLYAVAFRHEARLVALAPFYVYGSGSSRRLFLLGIGNSDYQDILIAPGFEDDVLPRLRERLLLKEWDLCDFQQLRESSPLLSLKFDGYKTELAPQDACPELDLTTDLKGAAVRAAEIEWPRAARKGHLQLLHADAGLYGWMMDQLIQFHTKRWSERELPGVLATAETRSFLREACRGLLGDGALRFHALLFESRPVAVLLSFLHQRRAYCYLSGFDPDYSHLSPGKLVMWKAILAAREEGAQIFDFLRGQEVYKYRWGARDKWNQRLAIWT